ncbi:hypothetical protein BBO99_00008007 [Phytophthora kernoviae]|uniref:CREG-like beta-barrel domain-containing protein n=1 Tax=Phytophthora kernoviae TaxID=325452 RepID=A0A3R7FWY4_9STRA|nr:hypothetical protein BBI17_006894 [Phytophthora kernoviae]RLN75861.1 hypothetical protein BBO99_00008007 [Phytophthora kernoviae]
MTKFNHFTTIVIVFLALSCGIEARRAAGVFRADTFRLAEDENLASPAQHARQLVHDNVWATLSTLSVEFNGIPYGSTVSYSDGVGYSKEDSTGKLFFYITPMDATGADLSVNSSASVAITMAQQGCKMDAEDPTCWKINLSGKVVPVAVDQRHYAEKVLFSKHPQMEYWPEKHGFLPYVLEIENIVLLDFYGGAKHVPVKEYYQIKLLSFRLAAYVPFLHFPICKMAALQFLLVFVLHFLVSSPVSPTHPVGNNAYLDVSELPAVSTNFNRNLAVPNSKVSSDKKVLPIFFFHGLTSSSADGANIAANITAEGRAFVALSFCENECSIQALNIQVPMAIAAVRNVVASDKRFKNGYIFMGHSMGGILARAVIEQMDDHKVYTLVSLAGALSGIFYGPQDADRIPLQFLAQGSAATAIPPAVFNFSNYSANEYRGKMQYDWARKLTDPELQATYSFANVARFPVRNAWSDTNVFMPVFNNMNKCALNDSECRVEKIRRKNNFLRIKEAHLFASPEDGVGAPWQMGQFGHYSDVETLEEIETKFEDLSIIEMHDTVEYKEDTFGLRTLDERGGVFFYTVRNVSHPCWLYDYSYLHTEGTCEFNLVYDTYVYKVIS